MKHLLCAIILSSTCWAVAEEPRDGHRRHEKPYERDRGHREQREYHNHHRHDRDECGRRLGWYRQRDGIVIWGVITGGAVEEFIVEPTYTPAPVVITPVLVHQSSVVREVPVIVRPAPVVRIPVVVKQAPLFEINLEIK